MKKFISQQFMVNFLLGASLIVLFTSYGNINVHPGINEMIVHSFLSKNQPKAISPGLVNYSFTLDIPLQCKGVAITKSGFFHTEDITWINSKSSDYAITPEDAVFDLAALKGTYEEGDAEHSVLQWIAHGGYSADVPEVPASLRHFYDPTQKPGQRYLKDITNAKLMGAIQRILKNPKTDGVDWALGKDLQFGVQEHNYTWEKGKVWMKMALEEKDKAKSNVFLGKAWRSLGETLHMIADNGCPPHVRNDAHPSPLWGNNNWLGNPDPYEELVDYIRKNQPDEFLNFASGSPDPDLKDQISVMKKVRDIAHALAVFTNKNFVTNETISGENDFGNQKNQVINSQNPYKSPLLHHMLYNKSDYTYSYNGVKQCVDHSYWMKLIPKMCEPTVNMACVYSQAAALIPNVIEAGSKVVELFIPKLKVVILSAADSLVRGKVIHTNDEEYISEIKYTGDLTLFINHLQTKKKEEVIVRAKEGLFEAPGLIFDKGDIITARIEFNDQSIRIESDFFKISEEFCIGQKYGGGIIFYLDATGQHGLIVAEKNQGSQVPWGYPDIPAVYNGSNLVSGHSLDSRNKQFKGTKTAIGTGQMNTNIILKACDRTDIAARLCDELVLNGYSDWFLPSLNELKQLWINRNVISGIPVNGGMSDHFWSSSVIQNYGLAYDVGLSSEKFYAFPAGMYALRKVRAVRAF